MSVKLIFCTQNACFEKNLDYVDYILNLPVKYDELKNKKRYTSGYVIYNENVILDFWRVFGESSFVPYKCERLEITYPNTWICEGFGYE